MSSKYKGVYCQEQFGTYLGEMYNELQVNETIELIGSDMFIWFGLSDLETEGEWVWTSGNKANYTNWYGGEPNGNTAENCGRFETNGKTIVTGTWNDAICFHERPFICQRTVRYKIIFFTISKITQNL